MKHAKWNYRQQQQHSVAVWRNKISDLGCSEYHFNSQTSREENNSKDPLRCFKRSIPRIKRCTRKFILPQSSSSSHWLTSSDITIATFIPTHPSTGSVAKTRGELTENMVVLGEELLKRVATWIELELWTDWSIDPLLLVMSVSCWWRCHQRNTYVAVPSPTPACGR